MAGAFLSRRVYLLIAVLGFVGLLTYFEQNILPSPSAVGTPQTELAYWQSHVARNQSTPASRLRLALAFAKNQRLDEAEKAFADALVLDPDYDAAAVGRYGAVSGQDDQKRAINELARYARNHSRCVVCWQNLAAEYLGLGQLRAAESAVENLLKSDFTADVGMYSAGNLKVEAFVMAGRVYASGGNHSKAIGFFRDAISMDPGELRARLLQAKSLLANSEPEAALRVLEMASQLADGDPAKLRRIARLQERARLLSARGRS